MIRPFYIKWKNAKQTVSMELKASETEENVPPVTIDKGRNIIERNER